MRGRTRFQLWGNWSGRGVVPRGRVCRRLICLFQVWARTLQRSRCLHCWCWWWTRMLSRGHATGHGHRRRVHDQKRAAIQALLGFPIIEKKSQDGDEAKRLSGRWSCDTRGIHVELEIHFCPLSFSSPLISNDVFRGGTRGGGLEAAALQKEGMAAQGCWRGCSHRRVVDRN